MFRTVNKFLVILLALQAGTVTAQVQQKFTPFPVQDTIPATVYETLKARLNTDKENVNEKGKVGAYMKTLYEQRFDYIVKIFNEDYFMFNDSLSGYLQKIVNEVYASNPQLPKEARIFSYRSESANAMTFGEGTISVMLGLLARVESEDVLAYVICHELAHHHAAHATERIERLADLNYDRVLKKQIADIMSSPYGRYTKMKSLFNSLDLSVSKHSREKEYEADSIGLTYFLKTRYSRYAPLRCMQILDHADSSLFTGDIDLKKYFHFAEYPFKDSWAVYKRSDVWHALPEHTGSDTANTHPDCMKRFDALKRQLKLPIVTDDQLKEGRSIKVVSAQASFEIIHSLYHFKQYGKALFYALNVAEKFPDNPYPHAMIAKSLYQLYKAQKNHELGKALELPDPRFEENYDRFLNFIHKLRLIELANLAYHYSITRPENFYQDEEFLHAVWMCSRLEISKLDPEKVRIDYSELFPDGKYLSEMKKY